MPLPPENLLSQEASPYLRQHAGNPVHWRPWSEAALAEARETGRPILLSIGYAACHWCHVMAHESFEDEAVAALMNRLYVNIKVDREERPDIDQIYMAALAATGEQGGWPLTMFLTPEAKPFWGGTYFPPAPRYGRPSFTQILETIARAWGEKRAEIEDGAGRLTAHVQARLAPASAAHPLSRDHLAKLAQSILGASDRVHGGLQGAPKFPNFPFTTALWLHWLESGDGNARDAVLLTLRAMLSGGIYDHVGGGLCRYATDAEWIVPHFEKMLYDNAQLVLACSWAYGETGEELFRVRIEETIEWLLREMRVESGAFASSLDADSDGEEGKFYTWTAAAVRQALGADADAFLETYTLASPDGWHGDPILHRLSHPALDGSDEPRLQAMLVRLRMARATRVRPGRDDKVLTDWNGLAIRALAEAARQFGRADWLEAARAAFRTVSESMAGPRLPHTALGVRRQFPGLSGDYAAMANAAIKLAEASHDPAYLERARRMLDALEAWHGDGDGGHFLTASDSTDLLMPVRGDTDEATSSATAQIVEALARLATATGDPALADRADRAAEAAMGRALHQAYGHIGIVAATTHVLSPRKLVMVEPQDASLFVPVANRIADPRRVDAVIPAGHAEPVELPGGGTVDPATPAAYLCIGTSCLPPVHDAAALEALLQGSTLRRRPSF